MTEDAAKASAELLKAWGLHSHKHAIDATVADAAPRQPGSVAMLTSDTDDMARLRGDRVRLIGTLRSETTIPTRSRCDRRKSLDRGDESGPVAEGPCGDAVGAPDRSGAETALAVPPPDGGATRREACTGSSVPERSVRERDHRFPHLLMSIRTICGSWSLAWSLNSALMCTTS